MCRSTSVPAAVVESCQGGNVLPDTGEQLLELLLRRKLMSTDGHNQWQALSVLRVTGLEAVVPWHDIH